MTFSEFQHADFISIILQMLRSFCLVALQDLMQKGSCKITTLDKFLLRNCKAEESR